MKIRARLTLWYAGILCLSTLILAVLSYRHFFEEHSPGRRPVGLRQFFRGAMEDSDDLLTVAIWFGFPAALIGLTGGWFLMRKALAPVVFLTTAAEKITDRNLNEQIPRSGNGDELDRLTDVFNQMTGRLDQSFQRIREFTLHASHELKTPLTIMRGEIETALREENLSGPQRERLLSQLDELERLTKIVDGLTLLTKADAGQISLKLESLQFDELVEEVVEDAKMLAEPHGIKVELTKSEIISLQGERHRLRQLLLNLLDNAIKYNHRNGTVIIELRKTEIAAELKISNSGPGIPPEKLSRVFERFFRCDESYNSETDGCGLGLSIVQWIVTAHGGSIQISSEPSKLTVALVSLPLKHSASP